MATAARNDPQAFIRRMQRDLVVHIEEVQGVSTLEKYQKRIARAVVEHDRVAISACHDVGKTFTLAKIVLALGSTFAGAKIITTAPTFNQVKRLLWSEIRTGFMRSKYPLGGTMLQTEWKIADDWFALGFSPRKEAGADESQGTASSFQGFHGNLVVIVFDEATGIPKQVWDQAEGMLTSGHVKFIAIGNPTSRASEFFQCFKSAAWHKIYLSCFDSPNLIANEITDMAALTAELDRLRAMSESDQQARLKSYRVVQPKLLSLAWVMAMAMKWGLDHPLFVSKVLGRFPDEDDSTLMSLGAVETAQLREYDPKREDVYSIGVDVARFGSDKSVITPLHGARVLEKTTLIKKGTTEVTGHVIQAINTALEAGVHPTRIVVVIDGTGIGSGVIDELREAQAEKIIPDHIEIREVHFGGGFKPEALEDRKLYMNRKAKLFVRLAQDLKRSLALSDDSVYLEELPTILYKFDSKGRYVIESKDDYKKRTGRPSPDNADSLALANEGRYPDDDSAEFTKDMNQGSAQPMAPGLNSEEQW